MKPKLFCAECNTTIQWEDKFCPGCGAQIELPGGSISSSEASSRPSPQALRCAKCGAMNASESEFCDTCGASLIPGTKRQHRNLPKLSVSPDQKKLAVAPATNSWKLVAGFFTFLVAGIVLMQLLSGTKTAPPRPPQPAEQSANMEAIPKIEEMEKQVAASPNNHELLLHLANVLQDNRFYERAIKYYKDYLAKHPKDASARVDMGICYNDMGNLEKAKTEIELALKYEPKHLFAHYNLGIVHLRAGEIEEANEWFKKVVALDPKSEVGQRAQQLLTQHNPQILQPN